MLVVTLSTLMVVYVQPQSLNLIIAEATIFFISLWLPHGERNGQIMKNNLYKVLSCMLLAFAMVISVGYTAFAEIAPYHKGEVVSHNTGPDMKDVVYTQQYLADLVELTKRQLFFADVDSNDNVDLKDVVMMQQHIAELVKIDSTEYYGIIPEIKNLTADYNSGTAMVGIPVTFTAVESCGMKPITYEFHINNEVVRKRSDDNTFMYTFNSKGTYKIEVVFYNRFDEITSRHINYEVVDKYTSDKPIIKYCYFDNIGFNDNTTLPTFTETATVFTAEAFMGKGNYQYRFILDEKALTESFLDKNTITLENHLEPGTHTMTIQFKDANSADEIYTYVYQFCIVPEAA